MDVADAGNKRINLVAPLISVRRHGGAGGAEATAAAAAAALPSYYKPREALGLQLGHTAGTVPFRWEHRPGHPKSVRTRRRPLPTTTTTVVAKEAASPTQKQMAIVAVAAAAEEEEEEERFFDARGACDDVSCCVTVNCSSAAGLSDATVAAAPPQGSRGGGAMMDRFLPAAHAVAAASPLSTFRKAGSVREPARPTPVASAGARGGVGNGLPMMQRRAPLQYIMANHDDDDDDDSDVHSTHGFASQKCGLLPTLCVKSTLLLLNPAPALRLRSLGARRRREDGHGPVATNAGIGKREMNPLPRRSRSGGQQQQQQPLRHTGGGHDPGTVSWEELYIKSLLRSARGGLKGPAAAVASELDRTVRELYRRRRGGTIVQPKASHLGLLLVLDRSNEERRARGAANAGNTALTLPRTQSSPNAAGGYGFPLLVEDNKAGDGEPGREVAVLSPRAAVLPLPLPKSPSESWLSRALPSVSNRPPAATSFLGLHVPQYRKHAPLPRCSIHPDTVVDRVRQRQICVHDPHK